MYHIAQVDSVTDSEVIALKFADHFQSNCKPFNSVRSAEIKLQYDTVRAQYCGSPATDAQQFDVELIGSLISNMKDGKAAGLDGLSCEHIKFSHPIVVSIYRNYLICLSTQATFQRVLAPFTQYRFQNAML